MGRSSRTPAAAEAARTAAPPQVRRGPWTRRPAWYLLDIALAHLVVLAITSFLFLLGETLFAGYATLVRDAVLVTDATQLSWLQRMASEVKAAIPWVVGVSAVLQMLLVVRRLRLGPAAMPRTPMRLWVPDFAFGLASALRAVGVGLGLVGWVSILTSAARQNTDVRTCAVVAATLVGVFASHRFARLPPAAAPLASEP